MLSSTSSRVKVEPVSPPHFDASWASDTTSDADLYWTDELLEAHLSDGNTECSGDSKAEVVAKILENLDQLDDLSKYINDDALSEYWMEERTLPIYEDTVIIKVPPHQQEQRPSYPAVHQPHHSIYDPTQNLLTEFETVLDAVNHHGALTPPQSPPYNPPVLLNLQPAAPIPQQQQQHHVISYAAIPNDHTYPSSLVVAAHTERKQPIKYEPAPATPQQTDVARELAVVDELVRSRVELFVPSSPSSSSSSNFGDCSSDDPEWSVDHLENKKSSRPRSKPYSRNTEDKKSRKKEQNKNAATRYRLKKKAEVEEILGEEKQLQDRNTQLEDNITELHREIKYLKNLMSELFRAKGLLQ